ncbi:P27 family phage terminase small subunit [Peribacillus frigoritolerans]
MTSDIEKLHEQLMRKIDTDDLMEVKKVQRYITLLKMDHLCDEAIKRDGATIVIENGKQRFVKSHPSMNDKTKINSQLIAIEKTFNFISEGSPS